MKILSAAALWLLACTMVGAFSFEQQPQAQKRNPTKPDFTGMWELKTEQSNFQIRPKPTSGTMSIDHKDPTFSILRTTAFAQDSYKSSSEMLGYNWKRQLVADGKPVMDTNGGSGRIIRLVWESDELVLTFMIISAHGMMLNVTSRYRLSENGSSIIISDTIDEGTPAATINRWVFAKKSNK